MSKKFYTVAEAARAKGVSRVAIHDAIKKGQLEHEWITVEHVMKKRIRVIPAETVWIWRDLSDCPLHSQILVGGFYAKKELQMRSDLVPLVCQANAE